MKRRVVVTGVGAVTPLGVGARTLHERWAQGVCGIVEGAGSCSEFEPKESLSVKEIRRLDRVVDGDDRMARKIGCRRVGGRPRGPGQVVVKGVVFTEEVEKYKGRSSWDSFWLTVRDGGRDTIRLFSELMTFSDSSARRSDSCTGELVATL